MSHCFPLSYTELLAPHDASRTRCGAEHPGKRLPAPSQSMWLCPRGGSSLSAQSKATLVWGLRLLGRTSLLQAQGPACLRFCDLCSVWAEAFIPHQLSAAHLPTCVAFAYALLKTLFANLSGLSEAELVVRRGKAVMRHRAQRGVQCKPKDEERSQLELPPDICIYPKAASGNKRSHHQLMRVGFCSMGRGLPREWWG